MSVTNPKPLRMMSLLANYKPFLIIYTVMSFNLGPQGHIVQFVKEDRACFELLFGNELQ